MSKVVCFGEVLWDVFPDYKNIGGAPLNVALRLNSYGNKTHIISCIGNDNNGRDIIDYLKNQQLDTTGIQKNKNYDTSQVLVVLDEKGTATYNIEFPCAWDFIELNKLALNQVSQSDVFIFGSLAVRNEASRKTLFGLLEKANYKVFDVNLRPPFYDIELLAELMDRADLVKFNDEELNEISSKLDCNTSNIDEQMKFIASKFNIKSICVTLGRKGARLFHNGQWVSQNGFPINVKDTVGAGDSFLATLVDRLLKGFRPQEILMYACAVGALVASKEGANPKLSDQKINEFIR